MCQPHGRTMPPVAPARLGALPLSTASKRGTFLKKLGKSTIRLERPLRESAVSIGTAKSAQCIEVRQRVVEIRFNRRGFLQEFWAV